MTGFAEGASVERQVTVGGMVHGFCAAGAGPGTALVLLHGIGSNAQSWAELMPGWGADRRVLAWNAPGYGASSPLAEPRPTVDTYVAALLTFLDDRQVARCDLLGHSLGGLIAARLAVAAPERVRRLMLSSPAGGYHVDPLAALPDNLAARIEDVRVLGPAALAAKRAANTLSDDVAPEVLARVQAAMAAITVEGYVQATWMLAQADILADAPRIGQPTLVLCGSLDRVTRPEGVRAIADAVPGARFELIEGAGHASYANRPAAYAKVIAAFVG